MKNITQKFIRLLALVLTTSFTVNAQCDETLILTSQGGNGGGSYGNWAWFAGDLRLWLEEGDIVYGSNGSAYTIGDEMEEYHYQNGVSQVWFNTNVAGVFTNGNSYNTTIESCTIEGCTESTAQNYMPNANTDDGSCVVYGCMDESASNFNSIATNEDDSCLYPGCTDPNYLEYDENANTDDGSCSCVSSVEISVTTTSEEPFEAIASVVGDYSSAANLTGTDVLMMMGYVAGPYLNDCIYMGGPYCSMAAEMINSEFGTSLESGDVEMIMYAAGPYIYECMYMGGTYCDIVAEMINPLWVDIAGGGFIWSYQDEIISTSDEVIISTPGEYTFSLSQNGCETLNQNFVVNGEVVSGCTNSSAVNYNEGANSDDGSCIIEGCTDEEALNYNEQATENDGSCVAVINGCMEETAFNYNADANTDDGSCVDIVEGCMEETAFNYNAEANTDDGSCVAVVNGCMDSSMSNYNSEANTEDGSCVSWEELANNLQFELDNIVSDECEEVATQNISLDLPEGWSMFGYTCLESLDVVDAFSDVSSNIEIVKDEWGLAYLPDWGFSAFDNLEFGEGYQIKMIEEILGFQFCEAIVPEDGVGQDDVNEAYSSGYDDGAASIIPEDGISEEDLVAAHAAGVYGVAYDDYVAGNTGLSIGAFYEGGIVFQINEDGTGLVAAPQDIAVDNWNDALNSANNATILGYSNWYIPSQAELEIMYNAIGQAADNVGQFDDIFYLSSSWWDSDYLSGLSFNGGSEMISYKDYSSVVRVIRAF